MLPATKSNQTAREDEQWPFFLTLYPPVCLIFPGRKDAYKHTTQRDRRERSRPHHVSITSAKRRRGSHGARFFFNGLRRGGKTHLGETWQDGPPRDCTWPWHTVTGQERKLHKGKQENAEMEARLLSWRESGIQAQHPHIYKNYHQNEEATWT